MTVNVETGPAVTIARIDDGKANALTYEVIDALRKAVEVAVKEEHPVVLIGRDGAFSGGFDLAVMRSGDRESVSRLLVQGEALFADLLRAPVPTVIACTGHAIAGGALLLLAADYRVGRTGPYKIGLNEVRIGMGLPEFAVSLARHRLDSRYLTLATCFAEIADPLRAKELGFLDDVVEDAEGRALERAEEFSASLPSGAFAVSKRRVRAELLAEFAQSAAPSVDA